MASKLRFYRQERYDTCALACLRMVLAAGGRLASEDQLMAAAKMDEGGVDITELALLAQAFGLKAEIRALTLVDIQKLLRQRRWSIVYLNRFPIDRVFSVHAVIPLGISQRFVTFVDPLRGRRRVSRRTFEAARRYLANYAVVCGQPPT